MWEVFTLKLTPSLKEKCPPNLSALLEKHKPGSYQHFLSELVFESNFEVLLAKTELPRERLRLQSVSRRDAGQWLLALPIQHWKLELSSRVFKILLRWWLGVPIYPYPARVEDRAKCPEVGRLRSTEGPDAYDPKSCDDSLDPWGDHAVCCRYGPSRVARHNEVNYVWASLVKSNGWDCKLEQRTDPKSRQRKADTYVYRWLQSQDYAHDWVITHTLKQRKKGVWPKDDPDFALRTAFDKKLKDPPAL